MKNIKTRYSTKPRDKYNIYVKGYGLLSFAKNMGKNLSNKYDQIFLDGAKKSTTDAINIASRTAIQKTAEGTGNLIGNKIADETISVSKKLQKNETDKDIKRTTPKKIYISPEERQQIIDEIKLV